MFFLSIKGLSCQIQLPFSRLPRSLQLHFPCFLCGYTKFLIMYSRKSKVICQLHIIFARRLNNSITDYCACFLCCLFLAFSLFDSHRRIFCRLYLLLIRSLCRYFILIPVAVDLLYRRTQQSLRLICVIGLYGHICNI